MTRLVVLAAVAAGLALVVPAPSGRVLAEGQETGRTSVAAENGVVVHGVDTKLLASRLRDVDQRLGDREFTVAAKSLGELTSGDLTALVEEGQGIYLSAQESVLQRVAALPPEALAAYRAVVDARARTLLAESLAMRDVAGLRRDAARLVFATDGPRALMLLADLSLARGDLATAERALHDYLRLLPAHVPPESLAGAASRLAGLLVARADPFAIRAVAADLPAAALEVPSPLLPERKLGEELAQAADAAAARATASEPPVAGPLRVAAEASLLDPSMKDPGSVDRRGRVPGSLLEHPLPIGTAERPALLMRRPAHDPVRGRQRPARVVAVTPGTRPDDAPPDFVAGFRGLWTFPADAADDPRPAVAQQFAPARVGRDLVAFTWPSSLAEDRRSERFSEYERHRLVVLSLSAEGKLVEERGGPDEETREDGDPELADLSFCGRPCVDGAAVYVTAIRPADAGFTELHLCRFDVLTGGRLHLRWRRHVLDGRAMPPAVYIAQVNRVTDPLAYPTAPLCVGGRVFVASNSGAVACLDAATGRGEWVETYRRFGPSTRTTVVASDLVTWDDVPLTADGAFLFAAPRDAETLLQFRRAPHVARSVRVEDFTFSGPSGTASLPGRILADLVPSQVCAVRGGVIYLAGIVPIRPTGVVRSDASPLAAFRLDERRALMAQVQEYAPSGFACLVRDALLFPTAKAVYRVRLDAFEEPAETLWTNSGGGSVWRSPDRIGNLVPDRTRLWSITPTRVLLLEPAR